MMKKGKISNIKLPTEIREEILSRLPVKAVLRFRSISKSWNMLLRDPRFVDMHLNRSKQNKSNFKLMIGSNSLESPQVIDFSGFSVDVTYFCDADIQCSCNGIVLLSTQFGYLWLLNPNTGDHIKVPKATYELIGEPYVVAHYGLGYDECTKDYKIVRIVQSTPSSVRVFSVRSNQWKELPQDEDTPFMRQAIDGYCPRPGLLVNGALHWISIDIKVGNKPCRENYNIIAFNVHREKFSMLSHPCSSDQSIIGTEVSELDGKLGVLCRYLCDVCDIWIMRDYGSSVSWTKLITMNVIFRIDTFFCRMMKKDDKLVFYHDGYLAHYDLKDQIRKVVREVPHFRINLPRATFYTESLVPLGISG